MGSELPVIEARHERRILSLVPVAGKALSPNAFVEYYGDLLSDWEYEFLHSSKDLLETKIRFPACLQTPHAIAGDGDRRIHVDYIDARRSGSRSAFWESERIQFKGCRPNNSDLDFPAESLPFGSNSIVHYRIPFGVMTAEAVLRELLGYCFCRIHSIPCVASPILIYAYAGKTTDAQFCCLLRVTEGRRVESFLRMEKLSVSQLISKPRDQSELTGSEVRIEELNSRWYADQKSRWLSEAHFRGGFRGLLNNNIGNDIVKNASDGKRSLLLCDFDTFKLIRLPASPLSGFLEAFVLQCVIEVVKGSLPILFFARIPSGFDLIQTARLVGEAYRRKSSLWNAYIHRFRLKAHNLSWNTDGLESAIDHAFETPAFLEASCSVILSEYALLRHSRHDKRKYEGHDVF